MERLTEKGESGYFVRPHKGGATMIYAPGKDVQQRYEGEIIDRLAHYEDLEERGRLVEVTRCRDCEHFREWTDGQTTCFYWTDQWDMPTEPDGFCHAAKKKAALTPTPASDVEGE